MGILWTCEKEIGCTFEVWDRTVSLEDWLENSARLIADPEWPAGKRHISDLRSADDLSSIFESDLDEVSSLFSIYKDRVAGLKLAIVSDKGQRRPEIFSRFVSSIGVTAVVFDNLESACAWLGIEHVSTDQTLKQLRAALRQSAGAENAGPV